MVETFRKWPHNGRYPAVGIPGNSMTQPFRLPDRPNEEPSREESPSGEPALRVARDLDGENNDEISQVARTLAAHGGAAVAFDLALDLVMNEIVEQARSVTGAMGAAIALMRDGELVCRATTGTNAPDLGMRVEMDSGLSGECLKTREIQQCMDTETDPRVNADACRQLGVRSMLIAPIHDGQRCFGILEVMSGEPHAFGEKDIYVVRGLARRVAQDKKEAEEGVLNPPGAGIADTPSDQPSQVESTGEPDPSQPNLAESASAAEPASVRQTEAWSSVLVVLVIAVAILLGVVIGWRRAALLVRESTSSAATHATLPLSGQPITTVSANPEVSAHAVAENSQGAPSVPAKMPRAENAVPVGGLIVRQNGKVIYKVEPASPPGTGASFGPAQSAANRIVHQVEPEYPAQAKAEGIQGPVVLDVRIGSDGRVESVEVASGSPLLAEAAVSAIKQWVYAPLWVNGKPVERQTRITIRFTLPSS